MKLIFMWFFSVLFCISNVSIAQAQSTPFDEGVQHLKLKAYNKALPFLKTALEQNPNNSVVLYNLSIAEFHTEHPDLALAYLRKAIANAPLFLSAHSLYNNYSKQMSSQFNFPASNYEIIRNSFLNYIPASLLLVLFIATLLYTGKILITFFSKRNISLNNDEPMPPFTTPMAIKTAFLGLLILICALKVYDFLQPHATLTKSLEVRSGPFEKASVLFEIYSGTDITFSKKIHGWAQITQYNGLSGWVSTKHLFQTSGFKYD